MRAQSIITPERCKCVADILYNVSVTKNPWLTNQMIIKRMPDSIRVASEFSVRMIIHELRTNKEYKKLLRNMAIIAGDRGYCLTKNKKDIKDYVESLYGRVNSITQVITSLEEKI